MNQLTSSFLHLGLRYADCPWMQYAAGEAKAGVHECPGNAIDPRVQTYLKVVGFADDAVPWCSAFANWCMQQAGFKGTGRAAARSWLTWGTATSACRTGAVAVFSRGQNPHEGHVGFFVGTQGNDYLVLGGNQRNAVCVRPYAIRDLLSMRWPS